MDISSIYPDFSQQQARLYLMLQQYKSCPPELAYGQMTIEIALANAERAMASGDRALISRAYHAMTEIE
jgi:hypothetical protein